MSEQKDTICHLLVSSSSLAWRAIARQWLYKLQTPAWLMPFLLWIRTHSLLSTAANTERAMKAANSSWGRFPGRCSLCRSRTLCPGGIVKPIFSQYCLAIPQPWIIWSKRSHQGQGWSTRKLEAMSEELVTNFILTFFFRSSSAPSNYLHFLMGDSLVVLTWHTKSDILLPWVSPY